MNSLVGVAAPSDPMGSRFIVKILYSVEGGDVKQVCLNLETISRVCDCSLSISHLSLYLACLYCFHLYMLDIYLCLN